MTTIQPFCITIGSLSIVQLFVPGGSLCDFLSGTKALATGQIEISEVSQAGSVNNLKVINKSNKPVFFSDGDILQGAKQNRVLNTSVLLAPNSETIIPVSCVEAGRWKHNSQLFAQTSHVASASLRAVKAHAVSHNFMASAEPTYQSDQSAVWDMVAAEHTKLGEVTSSNCLSEIYDKKMPELDKQIDGLRHLEGANAVGIVLRGKIISVDIFARPDLLSEYLPKLVRGALVDSYGDNKPTDNQETDIHLVVQATEVATNKGQDTKPSVGLGQETRFTEGNQTGFRLTHEGLIHGSLLEAETKATERPGFSPRSFTGYFRSTPLYGHQIDPFQNPEHPGWDVLGRNEPLDGSQT